MGAWADIRFPTYQEAAMNCTEEFIAKMKQKDIVINFVQAWRNDTLEEMERLWQTEKSKNGGKHR